MLLVAVDEVLLVDPLLMSEPDVLVVPIELVPDDCIEPAAEPLTLLPVLEAAPEDVVVSVLDVELEPYWSLLLCVPLLQPTKPSERAANAAATVMILFVFIG